MNAVLHPQLDVQQAQEVPDFGRGADRAFAPATGQTLFDSHRWRNAVDGVYLGAPGWLHNAARVRVERFQVAPLSLVKQDIECQRGFA